MSIAEAPALPLAVSLGDPAGIGAEVVAKSWERRRAEGLPPFFAVGDMGAITAVWQGPVQQIADPAEALPCFDNALPLIGVAASPVTPGAPTLEGARVALDSLEMAVGLTRGGAAAAVVTGPVSKAQLYAIGFVHPGQTEFVAERCGIATDSAAMMLAGPTLKVVPVTTHIPITDVPGALTIERIVARGRAALKGLQRQFGIADPRLAVAGLNPHAGESGALAGSPLVDLLFVRGAALAALLAQRWCQPSESARTGGGDDNPVSRLGPVERLIIASLTVALGASAMIE